MHPRPTGRLQFRQMLVDDLDEVTRYLGAPDPARPHRRLRTRDDAARWIEWNQSNYRDHGFGLWIIETHDGNVAGDCGLTFQEVEGRQRLEVGYHVQLELRGQGLATEAARAVCEWSNERGLGEIIANIRPDNAPSLKVARKLGFVVERAFIAGGKPALVMSSLSRGGVLRAMTVADVPAVVAGQEPAAVLGLSEVFPQAERPFPRDHIAQRWHDEIQDPGTDCFVIARDDQVLGFAATRGEEFLHFGTNVGAWGTGLAIEAHDEVLRRLVAAGSQRSHLWVFENNHRGRAFYTKLGWEPTGESRLTSFAPNPTLLCYQRDLRAGLRPRPDCRLMSVLESRE